MLGKLSVFAFIVGSGYLASGGFSWIIRQNGQIEAAIVEMGSSVGFEAEGTVLLAAFLAGMLLQAGVVQAWRGAFENGLISANTLLAIGLSVVSMVSSSGNALLAFKYNELTNAKLMAASAPMRSESEEAIAKVALLSQSADAMSNSSRARAREENLTGGSCSNVPAQRGKGSIWTMRQRHQSEAAEISRGLDALAFQLDGLLNEFETGSGSPDQRAKNLQRAVRDALRSSDIRDLFDRSQVLRNDIVLGWTHVNEDVPVGQPGHETERTCTDVGYQSTLEDFVNDFQGVMATRLSSVIIDGTGLDDGFALVFSDTGKWSRGEEFGPGAGALGFALLVELLQVLAVYLGFKEDNWRGKVLRRSDRRFLAGSKLDKAGRKRKARILARIEECTIHYRGVNHFACPNPRDRGDSEVIEYILNRGGQGVVKGVPWTTMNIQGWLDVREGLFLKGTSFDLYTLPEDLFEDIGPLGPDDFPPRSSFRAAANSTQAPSAAASTH